jgi:L-amino acid N-acyltransferase
MDYIIRNATENDLKGILEIFNHAILNTTAVYDYNPHTIEMRKKWFDDKMSSNIPVLVAELNNRIAGFASYGPFRAREAYKYSVEHSVYVHLDFRKQGIASGLLQQLMDEAKQKEIHTIIAGIDAENAISIHLHQKFGFEQTGHLKQVGYKFGKWLDLVFMQLILADNFTPND